MFSPSINITQLGVSGVCVLLCLVAIYYLWHELSRVQQSRDQLVSDVVDVAEKVAASMAQQADMNREEAQAVRELRDQIAMLRGNLDR